MLDQEFEKKLIDRARHFDLRPLLALLKARGFESHQILFRSALHSTSSTLIDALWFEREAPRRVYIQLNLGLLGDSSLLPAYFFETIEAHPNPAIRRSFYSFINFFDHHLLQGFLRRIYIEDNDLIFRDWNETRRSFMRLLSADSPATLQWLAQLYFPELRVHAARIGVATESASHSFRVGESRLDGSTILGRRYRSEATGMLIELIADEETDARGKGWALVVKERLDAFLLPLLAPFRMHLVVRLRVLAHASWARLEAPSGPRGQSRGFLGYDRLQTTAESGHTISIFRGRTGEPAEQE